MIIVRLIGGLGNQLFQYSTARRLAFFNKVDFKFDLTNYQNDKLRHYSLNHFNIIENIASPEEIAKFKRAGWQKLIEKIKPYHKRMMIKYRSYGFDPAILKLSDNVYLDGYWQSEKYFKEIEELIRKEVTLKQSIENKFADLIKTIKQADSISIHIRRGDYLSNKISQVFTRLGADYYYQAIEQISEKISNPSFFIFSDDINWAKENLKTAHPMVFVSKDYKMQDYEELILMSLCQHHIIANSSFSWWGAWLNQNPDKIIIGPKIWFRFSNDDQGIMPKEWIKI